MKKLLLLTLAMAATASSAFAQAGSSGSSTSQFIWSPPSQGSVSSNSSFTVTLSIQGGVQGSTTAPVDGYDLWLATSSANSGLFTIDSVNYSRFTSFGNIGPNAGDTLSNTTDISSGWVRNTNDLGNLDSSVTNANAIANGQTAQVATLTIDTGVLAPNTQYTFFTTLGANAPLTGTATSDGHYTHVEDPSTNAYTVAQSSFSITTVPEPATLSLFGLGSLGTLGITILRRCRA